MGFLAEKDNAPDTFNTTYQLLTNVNTEDLITQHYKCNIINQFKPLEKN